MLKIEFTNEMIFGVENPTLYFSGNEDDFKKLGKAIINLTTRDASHSIEMTKLNFIQSTESNLKIVFAAKPGADLLGKIVNDNELLFELDYKYWERFFIFFALMSWDKKTYHLNSFEDTLKDLPLKQQCYFICSSEF